MPKRRVLICTQVSELPPTLGDVKVACAQCGELVSVSPSSWTIIHDNPGIEIICTECALAQATTARSVRIHDMTPAQADEIAEYLGGAGG